MNLLFDDAKEAELRAELGLPLAAPSAGATSEPTTAVSSTALDSNSKDSLSSKARNMIKQMTKQDRFFSIDCFSSSSHHHHHFECCSLYVGIVTFVRQLFDGITKRCVICNAEQYALKKVFSDFL